MKILVLVLILLSFSPLQAQIPFNILTPEVRQGDAIIIKIAPQYQLSYVCISVFGKEFLPNMFGDVFTGIDVNTAPGKYDVRLLDCRQGNDLFPLEKYEITVLQQNFKVNSHKPKRPRLSNQARERIKIAREKEVATIYEAMKNANSWHEYTTGQFIKPLNLPDIKQTSEFGTKRNVWTYNNDLRRYEMRQSYHGGVDLKTYKYTRKDTNFTKPVLAINAGRVLLTGKFSAEGNMVIIDHGSGILSLYLHLSRIDVSQDTRIEKGDTLGLAGATGAVTGPHLHFMLKINGTNVDPLMFMEMINKYLK